MVEKWFRSLDKGELVGVILVDFRKAFDLVDHSILQKKMELYKLNQNWQIFFQILSYKQTTIHIHQ